MIAGDLYDPGDPELCADRARAAEWMGAYNASLGRPIAERRKALAAFLGACGARSSARPPFYVDYGYNIAFGEGVFLNYGCVILDVAPVSVGDRTQIGPYVQILTADHPRDPDVRDAGLEFGRPIVIGRNVWIGGGALVLPGVTVGDDAVIGAGSVVTRDVPPGETVVGAPARAAAVRSGLDRDGGGGAPAP